VAALALLQLSLSQDFSTSRQSRTLENWSI